MIGKTIEDIAAGDRAEIVRTVDMTHIAEFVDAVGDHNPIHSDPAFAAATSFKEPIAPGVFTAGMISAVIGTKLPGPGAIYLSQTLKFMRPVKPGDTITAHVEVLEVNRERNRMRLATVCRNQGGEDVLTGEAWVMPSRTAITYEERRSRRAEPSWNPFQPWALVTEALSLWGAFGLSMLSTALAPPRS